MGTDYEIVAEGRTGSEALRICRQHEPAVLIMELLLPEMNAATVIAELRAASLPTRTVIFTASHNEAALLDALRMRPDGFVHKEESFPALWVVLSQVARGGCALSPMMGALNERALATKPRAVLTSRERAVLQMIAEGKTTAAIAQYLGVSTRAIEHNRDRLRDKLGARESATLTRFAVQMGLAE